MKKLPEVLFNSGCAGAYELTFDGANDDAILVSCADFDRVEDGYLAARIKNRFNACSGTGNTVFPEGWVHRVLRVLDQPTNCWVADMSALHKELMDLNANQPVTADDVGKTIQSFLEDQPVSEHHEVQTVDVDDPSNPIVVLTNGQRFRLTITAEG